MKIAYTAVVVMLVLGFILSAFGLTQAALAALAGGVMVFAGIVEHDKRLLRLLDPN